MQPRKSRIVTAEMQNSDITRRACKVDYSIHLWVLHSLVGYRVEDKYQYIVMWPTVHLPRRGLTQSLSESSALAWFTSWALALGICCALCATSWKYPPRLYGVVTRKQIPHAVRCRDFRWYRRESSYVLLSPGSFHHQAEDSGWKRRYLLPASRQRRALKSYS